MCLFEGKTHPSLDTVAAVTSFGVEFVSEVVDASEGPLSATAELWFESETAWKADRGDNMKFEDFFEGTVASLFFRQTSE